ncbi:MAG: class I adenylate-forming enzyme family protein [Sphingomicrobium sp.]
MMRSTLDADFDEAMAAVTGPGGQIVVGEDPRGRPIATNLPATLPAFFDAFVAVNGAVEGLISNHERLTFAELNAWADKLAPALVARGIVKGDRVGIAMRNCAAWVVTYMAALKAGAVATLVNGWWQSGELEHGLRLTEPKLVIADARLAERLSAIVGGAWEVVTLPIEKPVGEALAPLLDGAGVGALPEVGPEDDATILFTSGSTGSAKGALSTHRAVVTGCYAYAAGLMSLLGVLTKQDRLPKNPPKTLLTVPLFHVTGEVPVLLNSFVVGRGMVLMHKWDAVEAMKLIERETVTYFVGVPTMSLELLNHPDRHHYDLSSLTDISAGGAPRPASHVQRVIDEFPGAQPALGYGLTETNAVGASNFWANYVAKPNSTGRAQVPFVELAIFADGDRPLPPGSRGEVAIRSAANIKEYWHNPEATAAALTADGWFRTGDIGFIDDDGYLFIVDRKKEIIIRGGENIASSEVEAALYAHEAVGEVAVFAAPDERLGEVPVAVVHATEGHFLDEAELRAFLIPRLAAFKVPTRFYFSDEPLPKLGTGKIDRVTLKAQFAHQ